MKLSDKDILFQDNHIILVRKPKGIPTQYAKGHAFNLEGLTKQYLQQTLNKSAVYLHAIYRLDAPVGGIVLMAKTSKALSRLNAAQRASQIKKFYLATIEGKMKGEGTLCHYIEKKEFHSIVYPKPYKGAKKAQLHFNVLQDTPCQVWIELITGRYHQIRAQLSFMGHPIKGDSKYGSKTKGDLCLDCMRIVFPHPITKSLITIELPGDRPLKTIFD